MDADHTTPSYYLFASQRLLASYTKNQPEFVNNLVGFFKPNLILTATFTSSIVGIVY